MRKLRKCSSANLNTGASKCPPEFGKMKGAILVESGTKLPADLTAESLEGLVHADRPNRVYGIVTFTEYAKNGGEIQTAANGYAGEEATGVSARKDTFTLNRFYPELHAALTKCLNKAWDVYFFDEDNVLYGLNDGTDVLAGYPMTTIYSDATPHPTSSARSTMSVTFSHADPKQAITAFDYVQLGFNPQKLTLGLVEVSLGKLDDKVNGYKIYEVVGGNDVTSIYGPLIVAATTTVINGSTTAVSYDSAADVLTIAAEGGAVISLKSPSTLYESGIKGIEQAAL